MSDAALASDVIAALKAAPGVVVEKLADGTIEIAAVGQPNRSYKFKSTVSRGLLFRFEGWYNVPIGAFYRRHDK